MDVLFENVYKRDKAVAQEFYRYCFLKTPLYIVLYSIYIVLLAINIVLDLGIVSYMVFIWVPTYFITKWMQYRNCVKTMLKRDAELFSNEPVFTVQITDEKIIASTAKGISNELELCNATKVVRTKNLILIFTKAKLCFMLRRYSFINGDEAELLSFLKSKGVTVK